MTENYENNLKEEENMNKQFLKRALTVVVSCGLALSVCACGGSGGDKKSTAGAAAGSTGKGTIKVNTSWGENSTVQKAALRFGELVQKSSNGRYKVKVYPSNQLASGNQQTAVEMVQNGDIEVSMFGMTVLSFLDDKLAVVNMPFLITSNEQADKMIYDKNAKSRQALDGILKKNGLESLAFGEAGFRQITNNKRAIKKPEDMKGLKFRVLSTCPMFFDLYQTLGANPTAINMSEVFSSLQQGVVDGQENAVDTTLSYKLNEVQNNITLWNGVYDAVAFVGSPKFMDKLSKEDQKMIRDCAEQAMKEQVAAIRSNEKSVLETFKKTMTITTLTPDEQKTFQKAVKPVYDKWYDKIGADLMTAFGYKK